MEATHKPYPSDVSDYDGHKRKKGSKVHMAVDTPGHLLALRVTPANEQARGAGGETGQSGAGGDRRLAKDYERLATTLAGLHFVAFVILRLYKAAPLLTRGS